MSGQYIQWAQCHARQPYLDELLAHWNGSHAPEPTLTIEPAEDALAVANGQTGKAAFGSGAPGTQGG